MPATKLNKMVGKVGSERLEKKWLRKLNIFPYWRIKRHVSFFINLKFLSISMETTTENYGKQVDQNVLY